MHFKKFLIGSALATATLFGSIPVYNAKATVQEDEVTLQQFKLAITSRISVIEKNLDNKLVNEIGLLYDIRNLSEYMMYYLQIKRNANNLGFSTSEVDYYGKRVIAYTDLFNTKYGGQSSMYTACILNFGDINASIDSRLNNIEAYSVDALMNTIPTYYETILDNLESDLPTDDAERSTFLRENAQTLEQLYRCIIVYQDVPITLSNVTPTVDNVNSGFTIDGSSDNSVIKNKITAIVQEHTTLLQYGKAYSLRAISQGLDIDSDAEPLEVFTNVTIDDGEIKFPTEIELSLAYKAMLASSSVYTPFDSYVGCSEFSNALISLADNDIQGNNLLKMYNSVKDYRKPLYKRTILSDGSITGPANLITLDEFIKDIENGEPGALVSVQGDFHYNSDVQAWIYSQNELTYDYSIKTVIEEDEDTPVTTEAPTTTENNMSYNIFDSVVASADLIPTIKTNAVDITNAKTMINSLENVIFVGGTYVEDLKSAFIANDADLSEMAKQQRVHFVSFNNAKYNWIRSALLQVNRVIKQNPDVKYTIIFNIGADDLSNVDNYITFLNEIASTDLVNHNVVFQSVGAVRDIYTNSSHEAITNNKIQDFNHKIRDNVCQSVQFVDVTTEMISTDGQSIVAGYSTKADGYHYTERTLLKLCMNTVKACMDISNSTPADNSTSTADSTQEDASTETSEETEPDSVLVTDDLSKALYAYDSITDENYLTQPVMFYGTKYKRARDNMTTAILTNIFKNTTNLEQIENKESRYLYVNAFGDIVTDDNLVILPGSANPIIYADGYAYNPYTVAFMNAYPNVVNRGLYFQVASENDIGKYVLLSENLNESIENASMHFSYITGNSDVADTNLSNCLNINPVFYTNTTDENIILLGQRCIYGSIDTWSKSNLYNYNTVVQTYHPVINETLIFPYNRLDDTNLTIAKTIAKNMYEWFAYNRVEYSYSNSRALNDNYLMHNFIISGLYGTKNPVSYTNDKFLEYKQFIATRTEQMREQLINLSDNLVKNVSNVSGTLGMDSSFEDPILGRVLSVIRENFIYFVLLIVFVVLIAFSRFKRDLFETAILFGATILVTVMFIWVIPIYMPMLFNFIVDKTSTSMAYEVLAVKLDEERAQDSITVQLDEDGNYKYNTASLTLYKVGINELSDFYDNFNLSESDVTAGKTHIVNQESGLFIEGDSLKVSIDILFDTLAVFGQYSAVNGSYCYQLKASKMVSNNMDYYTPYYNIVDNFIEKLNTLAQVYNLPKSSAVYIGGTNNTNYLLYSYVNSPVFLTPGNYKVLEQDGAAEYMEDYQKYVDESINLESQLTTLFGSNYDWLGIAPIFTMLTEESRGTLWAQTMQANGYYDYEWIPNEDKINNLIVYINDQTRDFIYDMDKYIGKLSDETMIKLVSLRALTAFNQKVSQFKNWLYPFNIDYAEIELGDLLNVVFTKDIRNFATNNWSIAKYIDAKHGWFALLLFDILTFIMFLVTNVIKLMIPILYLLLMAILLVRFSAGSDIKVPLRGYLKTSSLLFLMYTVFNISIRWLCRLQGSIWAIIIGLIMSLFVLYVIAQTLFAVLSNIFDFGDKELSVKLEGFSDKFHLNHAIQNLKFNTVNIMHHNRQKYNVQGESGNTRYRFDASVDNVYDNRLN